MINYNYYDHSEALKKAAYILVDEAVTISKKLYPEFGEADFKTGILMELAAVLVEAMIDALADKDPPTKHVFKEIFIQSFEECCKEVQWKEVGFEP